MKKFLIIAAASSTLFAACGGGTETNSNTANANSNVNRQVAQPLEPNNRPPGLSGERVAANSGPGIPGPGNANVTANMTPPGDPRLKIVGKDVKPGATPTPGIPDSETIRRQMESAGRDSNVPPPPPPGSTTPRPRKKLTLPPSERQKQQ